MSKRVYILLILQMLSANLVYGIEAELEPAATAARKRIPDEISDKGLSDLFEKCEKEAKNAAVRGASYLEFFKHKNFDLLRAPDRTSILKGMIRLSRSVFLLDKRIALESDPLYAEFLSRLERFSTNTDLLIKDTACVIRAAISEKSARHEADKRGLLTETEALLTEVRLSYYPFLQYMRYVVLTESAEKIGDFDKAFLFAKQGFSRLPETYHPRFLEDMECLLEQDELGDGRSLLKKEASLKRFTESEDLHERTYANFWLVNFYANFRLKSFGLYRPDQALKIYDELLREEELLESTGLKSTSILMKMARLFHCPEVRNETKAIELYEQIIWRTNRTPSSEIYQKAVIELIELLTYSQENIEKNRKKALVMGEMVLKRLHLHLSKNVRSNIEQSLIHIYQYGPEDIKNPKKALSMLEEILRKGDHPYPLQVVSQLAYLWTYGDLAVRNGKKAIEHWKILLSSGRNKENSLRSLIYLYTTHDTHKDPGKAAWYHLRAFHLYDGQPEKQCTELKAAFYLYARMKHVKAATHAAGILLANFGTIIDDSERGNIKRALLELGKSPEGQALPHSIARLKEHLKTVG